MRIKERIPKGASRRIALFKLPHRQILQSQTAVTEITATANLAV